MDFSNFHSISFPSEWGLPLSPLYKLPTVISIQLVSPASGDLDKRLGLCQELARISIQLVSPASGDPIMLAFNLDDF